MSDVKPPPPADEMTADVRSIHTNPLERTAFRTGGSRHELETDFGLLREFAGNWRGHGFNLVARPFFKSQIPFFLEVNETRETLDFTDITGAVPNRGSIQPDIFLHGVRYVQQVLDVETDTGIHIETGMWVRVPNPTATSDGSTAAGPDLYFRQSTIPHGDSLLAQSNFAAEVKGGPDIRPVNTTPFTDTNPVALNGDPAEPLTNPIYLAQYNTTPLPATLLPPGTTSAQMIKDPTIVLRHSVSRQKILKTIVLSVSTTDPAQIVNVPFVQKNANATALDAIFWVEWVELPNGRTFLQLQYVQRVILDFVKDPQNGKIIHWPHVSVATLKRI